jgi:CspA family cold shock protein
VHFKAIQADGFKTLKEGQLLLSSLPAVKGMQAEEVQIA